MYKAHLLYKIGLEPMISSGKEDVLTNWTIHTLNDIAVCAFIFTVYILYNIFL